MPPEIFEVHVNCVCSGAFSRLRSCRCSAGCASSGLGLVVTFRWQAQVHSGLFAGRRRKSEPWRTSKRLGPGGWFVASFVQLLTVWLVWGRCVAYLHLIHLVVQLFLIWSSEGAVKRELGTCASFQHLGDVGR